MPTAAPRSCKFYGCRTLARDALYCPEHAKTEKQRQAEIDARRESASKRGYGHKWRSAREAFLKLHPLCAEDGRSGRVVLATVVDHVIPHRGDLKLFWDRKNWQPLCARCHSIKTALEDGGFGNRPAGPDGRVKSQKAAKT